MSLRDKYVLALFILVFCIIQFDNLAEVWNKVEQLVLLLEFGLVVLLSVHYS